MMTKARLDALRMLAKQPRKTTAHTHGIYIGGRVAACLIRDGFAKRKPATWGGVHIPNSYEIHITDEGRRAIVEQEDPMSYNFDRPIIIHVCKDGTVSYRDKRTKTKVFNGVALPVFSVNTVEEAEAIQVRFCRLQYGPHPQAKPNTGTEKWFTLTEFSGEIEDLDRVSAEFARFYDEHVAARRRRRKAGAR